MTTKMLNRFRYFSLFGWWPIAIFSLVAPSIAGSAAPGSACSTAQTETLQTEALRQRLESLRNSNLGVTLSFTGLNQAFAVGLTAMRLRLGGCTYDVAKDMSGLIDILLGAKIRVGYPAGLEKYQPEARFGVYIGEDFREGVDLWFSNPNDSWVVGQSYDRGEVTAYRIMAAPTLRNALWDWARAQGYPRQNNVAACQEIEKYDPHR
jgi:hypothetical protein